jgi:hypothetical protein
MDMKPQVGEIAGRVWELLSSEGPQTVAQIKKKVKGSGDRCRGKREDDSRLSAEVLGLLLR